MPVLLFAVAVTGAQRRRVRPRAGAAGIVVGRRGAQGIGGHGHRVAAARARPAGPRRRAGRAFAGAARLGRPVPAHAPERTVGRPRFLDAHRPARRHRPAARGIRRAARTRVLPRHARPGARASRRRGRERRHARAARIRRRQRFGATIDGYTPAPNEEITLYYNARRLRLSEDDGDPARRRARVHRPRHLGAGPTSAS